MIPKELLVPLDLSDRSAAAIPIAADLAGALSAELTLVHLAHQEADLWERRLRDLAAESPAAGTGTEVSLLKGAAVADALVEMVEHRAAAMLCMSVTGERHGHADLGSVAAGVIRKLEEPVLLVGPLGSSVDVAGPAIFCDDGSTAATTALPQAGELAGRLGVELELLRVVADVERDVIAATAAVSERANELAASTGVTATAGVVAGRDPAMAAASHAAERGASLLVAASVRVPGLERGALGSFTMRLVRHASCPVLVIPTG